MQISARSKLITRIVTFAIIGGLLLFFIFSSIAEAQLLNKFVSAMIPFLIGAFIAFLLKPICNKLDVWIGDFFVHKLGRRRIESGKTTEKRVRRKAEFLSIFIAWILLLAVLVGIFFMIIPSFWNSVQELAKQFDGDSKLNQIVSSVKQWFEDSENSDNIVRKWIFSAYSSILNKFKQEETSDKDASVVPDSGTNTDAVAPPASDSTGDTPPVEGENPTDTTQKDDSFFNPSLFGSLFKEFNFNDLFSGVTSVIGFVANFLIGLLVSVISSVYILANRKRFAIQATMFAHALFKKDAAEWVVNEVKFANRKFTEFLTGKLVDSFIVGCLLFILFTIFDIPSALLIAVFMAFCNMIPFFGPFIGAIPCAFIVLVLSLDNPETSSFAVIYFLAIVLIVQQLDGNILDPFIVGDSIGLSSFWVLFAVIMFGDLFGFVGMFLGVPIFAVIYDIIRQLINFGLRKRGEEQLITNYNFIYHDPNEERAARKKRAAAIKAARNEARQKAEAEREEAMAREVAIAAARAEAAAAEAAAEEFSETGNANPSEKTDIEAKPTDDDASIDNTTDAPSDDTKDKK